MAAQHQQQRKHHFLVVTYPAQGHINPSLHLAKRLARTTASPVTFSTTVSAHRRMFPSSSAGDQPIEDGLISYFPFSDGYDDGFKPGRDNPTSFLSDFKTIGSRNLTALVRSLADSGRPVTCIIYSLILPWAANIARDLSIPSALYWIQPATVFAIYYHYFHGYEGVISAHAKDLYYPVKLPGLPELQIRDLPSFFAADGATPYSSILDIFKDLFETLDGLREDESRLPKVLVNTFAELEPDALAAHVGGKLDLIPIGPMMPPSLTEGDEVGAGGDLFRPDKCGYMEWLDAKEEGSVVYVSFGSISVLSKRQTEEILEGLVQCGRPYLWVLRKDSRSEGLELGSKERGDTGMVVEWCSQVKVLSHKAVGCFVTHCGWNSTLESLVCGVPTVGVPQWTDQGTNARLMEATWGTGVRGEVGGDGVLPAEELVRCLEVVMGEEEKGKEIRRMAATWKERTWEAINGDGGSSTVNLRNFVEEMISYARDIQDASIVQLQGGQERG